MYGGGNLSCLVFIEINIHFYLTSKSFMSWNENVNYHVRTAYVSVKYKVYNIQYKVYIQSRDDPMKFLK